MARWVPCSREKFIKRLRKLGFTGEFHGTKHSYMVYENHRLTIPNDEEYSVKKLRMMIREIEVLFNRNLYGKYYFKSDFNKVW